MCNEIEKRTSSKFSFLQTLELSLGDSNIGLWKVG